MDPCSDFYEFSCGNFEPKIPLDKTRVDSFARVFDKIQERLNKTINGEASTDEIEPFKKLKIFFHNCMEIGLIFDEL